jgi:NTP pyrophosphatase (non-canonical NTP hydrolase)
VSVYRDIYEKIKATQEHLALQTGISGRCVRLIKLQEEVGEVSQAYIGYLGANARKGHSHTGQDVAKELCDVVITAMVALHDWTDSPETLLKAQLQGLQERIKREGS